MTLADRILRPGDIITVHTPIGNRDFEVAKIDPTGKWAVTTGHDWFSAIADEWGCVKKKGHRITSKWYEPEWTVKRVCEQIDREEAEAQP